MIPSDAVGTPLEQGRDRGWTFDLVIIIGGLSLLGVLVSTLNVVGLAEAQTEFWILATLALAGELLPIRAPRGDSVEEIGVSTTFGFAILIRFGSAPAATVFAVASLVADLVNRKPVRTTLFNASQYVISVAAAGAVYAAFGSPNEVALEALVSVALAALAFFVVNDTLTGIAIALFEGERIGPYLLDDLVFQATTAAALCAMAPVVLVLADQDPFLVPLVVIPVAAVYWGATASLHNTQLIERLEVALAQEKELGRMKDDFVAVVSHELRTPLTSVQGYLKTLLQLGEDLDEEQRRSFLEAADRQSDRLRRLIEQLLVVARLESDAEPLTMTLVSVGQVARYVTDELRQSAHGHTFDLRFDPTLPLVETDEGKVHQILSNLVENALKYSPPDTRITVRGAALGDGVVVSVEDEGIGIPEEAQDRIFDRFYQVDSSATRSVGGTGLGLYICRTMADAIGGRLWLERSGADGTVFRVFIPGHPPENADRAGDGAIPGSEDAEASVSR